MSSSVIEGVCGVSSAPLSSAVKTCCTEVGQTPADEAFIRQRVQQLDAQDLRSMEARIALHGMLKSAAFDISYGEDASIMPSQ